MSTERYKNQILTVVADFKVPLITELKSTNANDGDARDRGGQGRLQRGRLMTHHYYIPTANLETRCAATTA